MANYKLFIGSSSVSGGNHTLAADATSYSFTGSNVNLIRSRRLVSDAATYTFTGATVNLPRARRLVAGSTTFSFTGATVSLLRPRTLVAEQGTFIFAGAFVDLIDTQFSFDLPFIIRGPETAQGGDYKHIVLNAAASPHDKIYDGATIVITNGTGDEQHAKIAGYNGSTKKARIEGVWVIKPDNTSTYIIMP